MVVAEGMSPLLASSPILDRRDQARLAAPPPYNRDQRDGELFQRFISLLYFRSPRSRNPELPFLVTVPHTPFSPGALTPTSYARLRTISEGSNEEFEYEFRHG